MEFRRVLFRLFFYSAAPCLHLPARPTYEFAKHEGREPRANERHVVGCCGVLAGRCYDDNNVSPAPEPFKSMQELSRKFLIELFAEAPAELFHYTNASGLHGILRSSTILGGNYAFMNDITEFTYGVRLLKDIAD